MWEPWGRPHGYPRGSPYGDAAGRGDHRRRAASALRRGGEAPARQGRVLARGEGGGVRPRRGRGRQPSVPLAPAAPGRGDRAAELRAAGGGCGGRAARGECVARFQACRSVAAGGAPAVSCDRVSALWRPGRPSIPGVSDRPPRGPASVALAPGPAPGSVAKDPSYSAATAEPSHLTATAERAQSGRSGQRRWSSAVRTSLPFAEAGRSPRIGQAFRETSRRRPFACAGTTIRGHK